MKRLSVIMELVWPDGDPRTPDDLAAGVRETLEGCLAADGGDVVYHYVISRMQDPVLPPQPPDGF